MTSIKDEPQEEQFAIQPSPRMLGPMTDDEYKMIQRCTQALNYLMSFEITGPFIMPAPRNYQKYYNTTVQTMDLTTVERHLYSRYYTSYQAFETHLSLIWRNAMKFHQQHSLIYKKAAMLEQLYNVFKQDQDQSLRSVSSDPVEVPPPPKPPQPPSRSEQMHSDLYIVVAVSPLESPLMVQHYENFAYARPVYDELHGPLFKQLFQQQEQHYQHQPTQLSKKLEPYPRLYISRNRHYLFNALEDKQQPTTMTILWNTHFETPPPPPDPYQQQYIDQLVIMTTHVTHGSPYPASHNAFRSAASYLPPSTTAPSTTTATTTTFAGMATTSDFDYSPQAWLKFQPAHTFYNIQMVISKRMVDAYFNRAFAIQPVSDKIQRPIDYPHTQPWINNDFDVLLVKRMKQCLISGKNDLSVLDQLPVPVPTRSMPSRQKNGDGDHPIVISDDEDDDSNSTSTSTMIKDKHGHDIALPTTMIEDTAPTTISEDNNGHDTSAFTATVKDNNRDTAPTEDKGHDTAGPVTIPTSNDNHDTTMPTEAIPALTKDTNTNENDDMLEQLNSNTHEQHNHARCHHSDVPEQPNTHDSDSFTNLDSNGTFEQSDSSSVSSTLLDVMEKLRELASKKGVKLVNVNDYMENSIASESGFDGHFKRVRYMKHNKALVVLLFKRMTTSQRVNEIICLLKLKGQPWIGNIVDILYADGDETNLAGFTMDRYEYTLKQYTQEQPPPHQHLTPYQKLDVIRQMLLCLQCIHEQGIGHRDLSEGNFMVDHADDKAPLLADGSKGARVRLIDFGRAMFTTATDVRQWWVGGLDDRDKLVPTTDAERTDDQLIPMTEDELDEWCDHLPMIATYPDHNHRLYRSIRTLPRTQKDFGKLPWLIDPQAEDVYSVGVLIWRVFTDKEPWNGVMEHEIVDLHVMMKDDAAIKLQVGRGISGEHSQRFLLKILRADHEDRLSAKKLLARLNTPHIAQGMLHEWATYYSSTSSRSRRLAAAARFQPSSRSKLTKTTTTTTALPPSSSSKKKKQLEEPPEATQMERRGSNSSNASSTTTTRSQKQYTKVRPSSMEPFSTVMKPMSAAKSTSMGPLAVDTTNLPAAASSIHLQPEMTKIRTQHRKIAPARSTSPHATLKSPSTHHQQPSSLPSTPHPTTTVHIPSTTPSYLASTPPTSPTQQPSSIGDSVFFTTNVANNPHFFLISYPPSHVRGQKRTQLTPTPLPPPSNFTKQHLNWMYDADLNLKLPTRGLVMGDGATPPSSTIFDEADSELTRAQTTPSYSATSNVKYQPTYEDAKGILVTGMKRKKSLLNDNDDDNDDGDDKATKKQHADDTHHVTMIKDSDDSDDSDEDTDMDELDSDNDNDDSDDLDDDSEEGDDSDDSDFYMAGLTGRRRKRGRTKSRKGNPSSSHRSPSSFANSIKSPENANQPLAS